MVFLLRNAMFTTFSQVLFCSLLLAVTSGQESDFIGEFKLKTNNNLPIRICCEGVVKMLWT